MSTKTLSGAYPSGYVLSAAYSELTITSSARLGGTTTAYFDHPGLDATNATSVVNAGFIGGNAGYNVRSAGAGVLLGANTRFSNMGVTEGGAGAVGAVESHETAGTGGGGGAAVSGGAYIANFYVLAAGNGGAGGAGYYAYGGSGGRGGAGVYDVARLVNHGDITGGAGGAEGRNDAPQNPGSGAPGGDGVYFGYGSVAGYVANFGVIAGGAGGDAYYNRSRSVGAAGGAGIHMVSGTITNSGSIMGGKEGFGYTAVGAAGDGIFLERGYMLNSGLIASGGAGGVGVYLNNANAVNSGTIKGGVYVVSASIVNSGLIEGGVSGYGVLTNFGTIDGAGGLAVGLKRNSRFVAEAGSSLVGSVKLGPSSILELASGVGTISHLGATGTISGDVAITFSGYGNLQIDPHTAWTLAGPNTVGYLLIDDGALVDHGDLTVRGLISGSGSLAMTQGSSVFRAAAAVTVAKWSITAPSVTIEENLAYAGQFSEGSRTKLSVGSGNTFSLEGDAALAGVVGGAGTLAIAGGATTIQSGATLLVAGWSLTGGITSIAESLAFKGAFQETSAAALSLTAGDKLNLRGSNTLSGLMEGGGRITVSTATVSALTVGGNVIFEDAGSVDQTGSATIGDATSNAATLTIDQGATWTMMGGSIARGKAGGSVINVKGVLTHAAAGLDVVSARIDDTGDISAAAGTLALAGVLTGTGALTIDSGARLEVDNGAASSLSAALNGPGAVLALKDPSGFAATISGFASGNEIDLVGITATAAVLGANDTLAITNGSTAVATLQLSGDYMGDTFSATSDGNGGTSITVSSGGAAWAMNASALHGLIAAAAALGAALGAGSGAPNVSTRNRCPTLATPCAGSSRSEPWNNFQRGVP